MGERAGLSASGPSNVRQDQLGNLIWLLEMQEVPSFLDDVDIGPWR